MNIQINAATAGSLTMSFCSTSLCYNTEEKKISSWPGALFGVPVFPLCLHGFSPGAMVSSKSPECSH